MEKLEWVTVLLTAENCEELYGLALPHKENNKYIGVSYVITRDYYVMVDIIGKHWVDLIIKSFDLLPQILLLQDLSMSVKNIRDTLNIPYILEEYNVGIFTSKPKNH